MGPASHGAAPLELAQGRLDRRLVVVMATATGLTVANNYYAQPLLPAIAKSVHISSSVAGLIVTAAQVGYAIGLVVLLPLGDLMDRRKLVVGLSLATSAALLWLGSTSSAPWLLSAALTVGTVSVLAQVLVPFSAALAPEHERGRVVGMVMSGLLVGILLARTAAGWLAETGSWRVVYYVAAALMLVQAALLAWRLPTPLQAKAFAGPKEAKAPASTAGALAGEPRPLAYLQLVGSVGRLLLEEPVLRLRSAFGMFSFASFSALWTSLAFVLARNYHYSSGVIGMFGLVGAAGASAASLAGRLADRGWQWRNTGACALLMVCSWAALWEGSSSVLVLAVGLLLFDFASQGLHITNQSEIYRLRPEARSRLTAAYMFLYFVGGAAGSVLSATLYGAVGWDGPCILGAAFAACALVLWAAVSVARPRQRTEPVAPALGGARQAAPTR